MHRRALQAIVAVMAMVLAACGAIESTTSTARADASTTTAAPPETAAEASYQDAILSLDSVTHAAPGGLITGDELVTLEVTVECAAAAGGACRVDFDFIANYGSLIDPADSVGSNATVEAGIHTVSLSRATRPQFTGSTVGVVVALYEEGSDTGLAEAEFRSSDLEITWIDGRPDEDQQALVKALVASFNARDIDGFLGAYGDSPPLMETSITWTPPDTGNLDDVLDELNFRWAMERTWELGECVLIGSKIECVLQVSDMMIDLRGVMAAALLLEQDTAGDIRKITLEEDTETLVATNDDFLRWAEETHPDIWRSLFREFSATGLRVPDLDPDSVALRVELLGEYLEGLDA